MGLNDSFKQKYGVYITSDWFWYSVVASFAAVIIRFIGHFFTGIPIYDNYDMLYAGFGLNLVCLNIISGKTSTIKLKNVNRGSVALLILIALFIAFCFSADRIKEKTTDDYATGKKIAFCICTVGSLLVNFTGNKLATKAVPSNK